MATILLKPSNKPSYSAHEAVERVELSGTQERGVIFTRREVVDYILDISGYTTDRILYEYRLNNYLI